MLSVALARGLVEVPESSWDALLGPDDRPLLSWGYLQGLEATHCIGPGTSWTPAPLLLYQEGVLWAATPLYLKTDSDGEWVWDQDWAEFASGFGVSYYPKLISAVPFNPVTGSRLLVKQDLPAEQALRCKLALLRATREVCQRGALSSSHLLFPREDELQLAAEEGYLPRFQEQYHFVNEGYKTFEDFLTALRPGRRHSIRRERRWLSQAGVSVRTHRGLLGPSAPQGFTMEELDTVWEMYKGTSQRYTAELPYLNLAFFRLCAERLGDRLELVLARDKAGNLLAGAFNLRGDRRLYGRHWGRRDEVDLPFLHFEVCFYHSIERCISEGLDAFEPGHGGDQKLLRGFAPKKVYSAHLVIDPRIAEPLSRYLAAEGEQMERVMEFSRSRSPLAKLRSP